MVLLHQDNVEFPNRFSNLRQYIEIRFGEMTEHVILEAVAMLHQKKVADFKFEVFCSQSGIYT